jgi:hypothetical protein
MFLWTKTSSQQKRKKTISHLELLDRRDDNTSHQSVGIRPGHPVLRFGLVSQFYREFNY